MNWIKKILIGFLVIVFTGFLIPQLLRISVIGSDINPLQIAEQTVKPNTNYMFASNASLAGRIYMTFSGKEFKPCINTVSSFFNKYH